MLTWVMVLSNDLTFPGLIDGLVQENRNSIANALELRLSWSHEPLARYVKLRVVYAPRMPGAFFRHCRLAIPTCITARA